MQSTKKICIVGTGGFGREALCCLIDSLNISETEIYKYASFMVDDEYFKENQIMNVEVIPRSLFNPLLYEVVIAVGEPIARKKIVESLPAETKYASIIHPSVVLSKWVKYGEGTIITAGSVLTCNIEIGKHAHINLLTTIGHDCIIGDYFTTAPGANISGNCRFGNQVYFGTNSSAKQGVNICDNVTIGMGGVVLKDIIESGVYIGMPAKKLG